MKRISSSLTLWWYKRLGPWLLGAAVIAGTAVLSIAVTRGTVAPLWLFAPVLLALVALAYLRRFVFPLADEVFDAGDALLVRRGRDTARFALRDITSIEYSLVFDPPRICFASATPDGKETVTFMPHLFPGMCFFRPHPLVADLRTRIGGGSSAEG